MAVVKVKSNTYGEFEVIVDDDDYERICELCKDDRLSVRHQSKRPNLYYFQKRIPGHGPVLLHRFIMNAPKGMVVDHINGNTLDNRKENLRVCTNAENVRTGRPRRDSRSGYAGVVKGSTPCPRQWAAQIVVNYKLIRLGYFATPEEAARARKDAEKKYWNIN